MCTQSLGAMAGLLAMKLSAAMGQDDVLAHVLQARSIAQSFLSSEGFFPFATGFWFVKVDSLKVLGKVLFMPFSGRDFLPPPKP